MSDLPKAVSKAGARLTAIEQDMAAGTWRPTPEAMTAILRHTLGIVAALQATVTTATVAGSS